jgi:hypothetical protein
MHHLDWDRELLCAVISVVIAADTTALLKALFA